MVHRHRAAHDHFTPTLGQYSLIEVVTTTAPAVQIKHTLMVHYLPLFVQLVAVPSGVQVKVSVYRLLGKVICTTSSCAHASVVLRANETR